MKSGASDELPAASSSDPTGIYSILEMFYLMLHNAVSLFWDLWQMFQIENSRFMGFIKKDVRDL